MWLYKGKKVKSIKDLPKDSFGYIYKISNIDTNSKNYGLDYVGKKQLIFQRKKQKTKAERNGKRKSKKLVVFESDWKTYNSSCKPLLEDIKNGAKIKKEILLVVKTKRLLTYFEVKYQFLEEVLEKDSYNMNISGRYFRSIFNQ